MRDVFVLSRRRVAASNRAEPAGCVNRTAARPTSDRRAGRRAFAQAGGRSPTGLSRSCSLAIPDDSGCVNRTAARPTSDRRAGRRAFAAALSVLLGGAAPAARGIPLAPLGGIREVAGGKRTPDELTADVVKDALREGLAGPSGYFVNPDVMPTAVFADDAIFADPTNTVTGLSRYIKALGILFDTEASNASLIDIAVVDDVTIAGTYEASGTLKLPWRPCVRPYTGRVT